MMDKLPWNKPKKEAETERVVIANNREFNSQFTYANNEICTSKYTLLTFWPKNLFEQFQRLANAYFLTLLVLQLIPAISALTPLTTIIPLVIVLSLTALKDAVDDVQRHRSDRQVNQRVSLVVRDGKVTEEQWHNVRVGDVIRMENNHFIAADLLLLSSSEPHGLCYIETAELDGETNLKCRQAIPELAEISDDLMAISNFNGEIRCEPPNNNLNKFKGKLSIGGAGGVGSEGETYSLDNDKMLLRGCILRNTRWCYGLVVFAGADTKLMMNSGNAIFKRTRIDRFMNKLILGIFAFLGLLCLFCTVACGVWETTTGQYFQHYLPREEFVPENNEAGATVISLLVFLSYIIVLNTVVPISLYVSVEVIRFAHSWWINWDDAMYYPKSCTPARARTTTLNEELGQVEYIFSDKTGTLTQNVMTFNKCSINTKLYGYIYDQQGQCVEPDEESRLCSFEWNADAEKGFEFYDQSLIDAVRGEDGEACEFFRLLALCHTVMPETKEGVLTYAAQSPDEGALVSAARNFGFVFKSRTPTTITIETFGVSETYELLTILDFNNDRKRMSVILKKDNRITLYCKGADSKIYERLSPACNSMKDKTSEHLNKFACEGLRTLCLASKDIDESYFNEWRKRHHEASTALDEREEKLEAVYEEIEQELVLLGATAIEDKLQDGVPECIANLALADMKIWVLTGDKQETAINIGYSCRLLTDDMNEVFIVDGETDAEVRQQLQDIAAKIDSYRTNSGGAGVNGNSPGVNNPGGVATADTQQTGGMAFTNPLNEMNSSGNHHNQTTPQQQQDGPPTLQQQSVSHDSTSSGGGNGFAIVVNGHSLVYALTKSQELLFLDTACKCKAVICCRVTPLQKANVVELVKKQKKAVTLSIGDGANDVSMIKKAHIGVGISGQEGLQAVLASDFSLAQFRYLERLLLVHGRWSYVRMCKFLRYFFFKNFIFTLCHFWFAFFCAFSAQTLFDPWFISLYNVFYTSMPVLALAIFDQDCDEESCIKYPRLYTPGHRDLLFNRRIFLESVLHGIVGSLILVFVPYGSYVDAIQVSGKDAADLQTWGVSVSAMLVVAVTFQVALDMSYWTVFNFVVIFGSPLFYVCVLFFMYSDFFGYNYVGTMRNVASEPVFWFTLLLTVTILMVPVISVRFYYLITQPTLSDRVRLKHRLHKVKSGVSEFRLRAALDRALPAAVRKKAAARRRTGYAFAHEQGFGELITTGAAMRLNKDEERVYQESIRRKGSGQWSGQSSRGGEAR